VRAWLPSEDFAVRAEPVFDLLPEGVLVLATFSSPRRRPLAPQQTSSGRCSSHSCSVGRVAARPSPNRKHAIVNAALGRKRTLTSAADALLSQYGKSKARCASFRPDRLLGPQ
jgi:hypothetical protein